MLEHLGSHLISLLVAAVAAVLAAPVAGWALMLLAGVLHHQVHPGVPLLGYGPSVAAADAAAVVVRFLTAGAGQ